MRKLLGVMGTFAPLIVVIVSWVYAYVKLVIRTLEKCALYCMSNLIKKKKGITSCPFGEAEI